MANAFSNKDSKRTAIVIIIISIVVILILSLLFGGAEGLFGVLKFFLTLAFVVAFIGGIVYVVYYLFIKKHPRNIPYENWKDYLKSALDNGADMMQELILTGDKFHSAKSFMTIKGYLRIKAFDGSEYDLFVGKKSPMNFLEEHKIVMLKPDQHSELIGDVYVEGISLIKKYGFYFLNQSMMDFETIDQTVAMDTFRSLMYETLGDIKQITDRAIGLDPEFRKRQLDSKLLKIPQLAGQQQQSGEQQ